MNPGIPPHLKIPHSNNEPLLEIIHSLLSHVPSTLSSCEHLLAADIRLCKGKLNDDRKLFIHLSVTQEKISNVCLKH